MSPVIQGVNVPKPSLLVVPLAMQFLVFSSTLVAQNANPPQAGSIDSTPPAVQQTPPSSPIPFGFSGVLYLNYQYGGPVNNQSANRFDVDRAYLNFRAAAGTRDSIRVTVDVFQQRDPANDDFYGGWAVRFKYAWLNHEFVSGSAGDTRVYGRIGLLPTVIIDKEEQYWNRGLSQAAVELAGYFSSSDAGAAGIVSLPDRLGEVYATIVNGNGYASRELDRFKDYQVRVTLSPWANGSGFLKGLEFSPWVSFGGRASDFAAGQGTLMPVTEMQKRNRYGLFTGYRDSRFVAGLQLAQKVDASETADTLTAVTPTARTVTGSLVSAFVFWRPLASPSQTSPWSLVFRVDNVEPDDTSDGSQRRYIAGTTWDFNRRTSVTLDLQTLSFRNGLPGTNTRTVFLHLIANF